MSLNPFGAKSLGFKIVALNVSVVVGIALICQFYLMPKIANVMQEDRKTLLRVAVEGAIGILDAEVKLVKEGKETLESAQSKAIAIMDTLRYNEKEYFFVIDMDGKMIHHPISSKLNGTSVLEMKDPEGVQLFAEMIKIAKDSTQGYLPYMWPKPGAEAPVKKYSFVKVQKDWNWIIGTGLYNDDIEAEISAIKRSIWGGLLLVGVIMSVICLLVSVQITRSVSRVSDGIARRSQELRHISDKVNAQSQGLSASTVQSSSALQETSASLTEISSMITKTSQHVSSLQGLSNQFETQVSSAGDKIDEMSSVMRKIEGKSQEFSDQATSSMEELRTIETLFSQISEKTKVINDIVFQTKLLSFNASVEAARAGESGKGFAVVAQEVGSLAEMSGKSALEISQILAESGGRIESIIRNSQERNERMISDILESLRAGSHTAQACRESFVVIVEGTHRMGGMVTEISHASNEQTLGVQEITKAVGNLEQATQDNATIAQAASSDAEALLQEANGLHDDTSRMSRLIRGA